MMLTENSFLTDVIFELMKMNKVKLWVLFGLLVNSQFQGICSVPSDKVVHVEESILSEKQPRDEVGPDRSVSSDSPELYREILHMDSVLFNAFNAQDLEQMKNTFSTDLEFYHDKGGLTDYNQTIANFKSLFEKNLTTGLRRDLEISSVEVYSIKDFGALEVGMHKFCHVENGKEDCGTFKFIHIWHRTDGQWKLTRVISYDH